MSERASFPDAFRQNFRTYTYTNTGALVNTAAAWFGVYESNLVEVCLIRLEVQSANANDRIYAHIVDKRGSGYILLEAKNWTLNQRVLAENQGVPLYLQHGDTFNIGVATTHASANVRCDVWVRWFERKPESQDYVLASIPGNLAQCGFLDNLAGECENGSY